MKRIYPILFALVATAAYAQYNPGIRTKGSVTNGQLAAFWDDSGRYIMGASGIDTNDIGQIQAELQAVSVTQVVHTAQISSLFTTQAVNTAGITGNDTDISNLFTTQTTHTANITANDTDISNLFTTQATHTANITANDTDISNLFTTQVTQQASITALTTTQGLNAATYVDVTGDRMTGDLYIGPTSTEPYRVLTSQEVYAVSGGSWAPVALALTTTQATHTANITSLFTTQATHTANITANDTDISNLFTTQATHTANITANDTDISNLFTTQATHTANITANDTDISNLFTTQATHTANITANDTDISNLFTTQATHTANITANDTDISNLFTTQATHTANITANDTDISNLFTTQVTQQASITALTTTQGLNAATYVDVTGDRMTGDLYIGPTSTEPYRVLTSQEVYAVSGGSWAPVALALTTTQATHTANITSLFTTQATHTANITANDTDISNLFTTQATHTANITANDTDISNLFTTQATHTANITANDTDISNLFTTQATHTAQISSAFTTQATHTAQISSAFTTQTTHTVQISSLFTTQAVNTAGITANDTDISNLFTTQATHTAQISSAFTTQTTHTADIAALTATQALNGATYVNVTGDTMTGDLTTPGLQFTGEINVQTGSVDIGLVSLSEFNNDIDIALLNQTNYFSKEIHVGETLYASNGMNFAGDLIPSESNRWNIGSRDLPVMTGFFHTVFIATNTLEAYDGTKLFLRNGSILVGDGTNTPTVVEGDVTDLTTTQATHTAQISSLFTTQALNQTTYVDVSGDTMTGPIASTNSQYALRIDANAYTEDRGRIGTTAASIFFDKPTGTVAIGDWWAESNGNYIQIQDSDSGIDIYATDIADLSGGSATFRVTGSEFAMINGTNFIINTTGPNTPFYLSYRGNNTYQHALVISNDAPVLLDNHGMWRVDGEADEDNEIVNYATLTNQGYATTTYVDTNFVSTTGDTMTGNLTVKADAYFGSDGDNPNDLFTFKGGLLISPSNGTPGIAHAGNIRLSSQAYEDYMLSLDEGPNDAMMVANKWFAPNGITMQGTEPILLNDANIRNDWSASVSEGIDINDDGDVTLNQDATVSGALTAPTATIAGMTSVSNPAALGSLTLTPASNAKFVYLDTQWTFGGNEYNIRGSDFRVNKTSGGVDFNLEAPTSAEQYINSGSKGLYFKVTAANAYSEILSVGSSIRLETPFNTYPIEFMQDSVDLFEMDDGGNTSFVTLDMNSTKITGLADGTVATDAATYGQLTNTTTKGKCEFYLADGESQTFTAGTWANISNWTANVTREFAINATGGIMTNSNLGDFLIEFEHSFGTAAAEVLECRIYTNGVVVSGLGWERNTGASLNNGVTAMSRTITLPADTGIELKMQPASDADITWYGGVLRISED